MCEKYEWCTVEDDLTVHHKEIGYGIQFSSDEQENSTYVWWGPDWCEWIMRPGEVEQEVRPLKSLLSRLPAMFEAFITEVTGKAPEPGPAFESRSCPDPDCVEEAHDWLNGEITESCALEPIESPDGWFRVHASRMPGESWEVSVDADRLPDGRQASIAVSLLADAIEEMQARLERLNDQQPDKKVVF